MYLTVLFVAWLSLSTALYTPKGSSCSIECGTKASNFTGTGDLVCQDTAYDDNSKGVLLKQCVECLGNSSYVNDAASYNGNSDQYWYLWHLKYVQQYCLIDTPQTAAAKNCDSQCTPMRAPLRVSWIYNKGGVQSQYDFCSWNSSAYMTYAEECATCLQAQEGGVIIGNIADTTYNACKSQPKAVDGDLVTSSRDLFDSDIIEPTATTATTSSASTSTVSGSTSDSTSEIALPASSTASRSTSSSQSDRATTRSAATTSAIATSDAVDATSATAASVQSNSGGLSSPAAAGIGIAATLLTLAIAAGAFFMIRRRRRAPASERLMTPPAYVHELGNNAQVSEMEGREKAWHKILIHETGGLPLQELDASGRR